MPTDNRHASLRGTEQPLRTRRIKRCIPQPDSLRGAVGSPGGAGDSDGTINILKGNTNKMTQTTLRFGDNEYPQAGEFKNLKIGTVLMNSLRIVGKETVYIVEPAEHTNASRPMAYSASDLAQFWYGAKCNQPGSAEQLRNADEYQETHDPEAQFSGTSARQADGSFKSRFDES